MLTVLGKHSLGSEGVGELQEGACGWRRESHHCSSLKYSLPEVQSVLMDGQSYEG